MTVKERILAIRLAESIQRQPEYARRIGILSAPEASVNRISKTVKQH